MKDHPGQLRVALVQLLSGQDALANGGVIRQALESAATQGAGLAFFPENSLWQRVDPQAQARDFAPSDHLLLELHQRCQELDLIAHLGSCPVRDADGNRRNSTIVLGGRTGVEFPYSKIHLFDVDIAGQKPIRESEIFAPGDSPKVWESQGWRWGLSVCYDLRFSELFRGYAAVGVDAISVPSAFTVPTGRAHWHVLLRARAIESQCYVVAAAQGGSLEVNGHSRHLYGHSVVIDPWGEILLDLGESVDSTGYRIGVCDLNRERLETVRMQIPMGEHRRARCWQP